MALKRESDDRAIGLNQLLCEILKKEISQEKVLQALQEEDFESVVASEMITVEEYAAMWGKSVERIKLLCREGRLSAYKQKRDWLIPRSVPYPEDRRKKENL